MPLNDQDDARTITVVTEHSEDEVAVFHWPSPDWETRYRTLEVIAAKRLEEMVRLVEENADLRRKLRR